MTDLISCKYIFLEHYCWSKQIYLFQHFYFQPVKNGRSHEAKKSCHKKSEVNFGNSPEAGGPSSNSSEQTGEEFVSINCDL